MSADNFVGVSESSNGWTVLDGSMSRLYADCQYRGESVSTFASREDALVAAHDYARQLPIVEYGVIELDPPSSANCGRCFVCIYKRGVIDPEIERCTRCNNPIHSSEFAVLVEGKVYHNRCEPR